MAASTTPSITSVVNVKVEHIRKLGYDNLEQWCSNPNHVYIGRKGVVFVDKVRYPKTDSKWANPFTVKKYGRAMALYHYYEHLYKTGLINQLGELQGKTLGCWCVSHPYIPTPGVPAVCHGQILANILAGLAVVIASDT